MYKVTLSMPIYNVAPYVERALLSALNQTFESIEFLLVDDRGTDNSMDIVRRIIKEHPRGKDVRIIEHPHNIGLGATRNTAIDNAQGEYLFFMDSDDEITLDCIQVLYDRMMEEKVDIVVGSYIRVSKEKKPLAEKIYKNIVVRGEEELSKFQYSHWYEDRVHISMWNKLYDLSRVRYMNILCVPNQLNEDNMFTTKCIFQLSSCSFVSKATYLYYEAEESTMHKMRHCFSKRLADQFVEIINFHKENLNRLEGRSIYCNYYRWVLHFTYSYISCYLNGNFSDLEKRKYLFAIRKKFPVYIKAMMNRKVFIYRVFVSLPLELQKIIFAIYNKL